MKPGLRIGETDTVIVTFRVTLGTDARNECWRLTDDGPLRARADRRRRFTTMRAPATGPTWVDGQRVRSASSGDHQPRVQELRYVARVVDPGSYAWEPAVLQSSVVPDQGVATPAGRLVIDVRVIERAALAGPQSPARRRRSSARIAASSSGSAWSQPQTCSVPWVARSRGQLVACVPSHVARLAAAAGRSLVDRPLDRHDDVAEVQA